MYDEPVLISALTHWVYCPRRAGLVHLESVWDENVFTIRGTGFHERVDSPITRAEKGKRVERALPIWSNRLGLIGKGDVVEFLADGTPVPVEYKSGSASERMPERIQLCAQAFCLEEMFGRPVPEGAVYYVASKMREPVLFDDELRLETLVAIESVRAMIQRMELPAARFDRRCGKCSLIDACIPQGLVRASTLLDSELYRPRKEAELP
jgi:CRISPR-associated exonuclease Cas4